MMFMILSITIILGAGLIALLLKKKKALGREEDSPGGPSFNSSDVRLVADFDKIVADPIPFKVHGKTHFLKPIDMKEFILSADAMASTMERLENLNKDPKAKLAMSELLKIYYKIISSVCDTITMSDIKKMSQPQARAVFQLVYDHIAGRLVYGPDTEKKSQ